LTEINHTSHLLFDPQFNFYLAGLYLSKIGDRSQQQIILKLLDKKYLLPLIAYAIDQETNYFNRYDLMKVIPTAACVYVSFPYNFWIYILKYKVLIRNKHFKFEKILLYLNLF